MVLPLGPDDAPPAAARMAQEAQHFIVSPLEGVLIFHQAGGAALSLLGRRALGRAAGFLGILAHKTPIEKGPFSGPRKSYNLLPFPIIAFFVGSVNPKGGKSGPFPVFFAIFQDHFPETSRYFATCWIKIDGRYVNFQGHFFEFFIDPNFLWCIINCV